MVSRAGIQGHHRVRGEWHVFETPEPVAEFIRGFDYHPLTVEPLEFELGAPVRVSHDPWREPCLNLSSPPSP